jgi:hypothetical protein
MSPFVRNLLWTGAAAAAFSMSTAAARSRIENRRADTAFNAQSHIVWGGRPPAEPGPRRVNTVVGSSLHVGAGFFWAGVFELIFGRWARRSDLNAAAGGAATALAAYVIDYKLVPQRIRPGFEFHLSRRSLHCIYGALGAGIALAAMCTRRHHAGASGPQVGSEAEAAVSGPAVDAEARPHAVTSAPAPASHR